MDRQSSGSGPVLGSGGGGSGREGLEPGGRDEVLSRRKVFVGAVGLAAVGVTGGSLLAEGAGSAASAAVATTVEQGAVAPTVVALTDAATIGVDASLGNDFRVTLGASRAMGNPASPVDGQIVVFQVTQGAGGSSTVAWGSSYEFSAGMPEPVLSTGAGETDLLTFIYNQGRGAWLLSSFVKGLSAVSPSPSPSVTPSPTPSPTPTGGAGTFRLFPATAGPSSPASYSGPFLAGVVFQVTKGGVWFDGYWWWVCPSGQSTSAQSFALWQVTGPGAGTLIPSATATSGALTAGQWNYVPLATPIPLAIGAPYMAVTGFSGGFPNTANQFGGGDPYSAGITNGPLFAYSDSSGSAGSPTMEQGLFSTAGTDPTANLPGNGYQASNFWMDVQVDTNAPSAFNGPYRLWPNYPVPYHYVLDAAINYELATEFKLSQSCTLDKIWFYSPACTKQLPTDCGIWDVPTQTLVSGTHSTSPSWSGAAGSGWVSCAYTGITLAAGDYKAAVLNAAANPDQWSSTTLDYWANPGPGQGGIKFGPLSAPNITDATGPGQCTYHQGTAFVWPGTYSGRRIAVLLG